jgi:hypothetical protein
MHFGFNTFTMYDDRKPKGFCDLESQERVNQRGIYIIFLCIWVNSGANVLR